jgi:hypothetical protein
MVAKFHQHLSAFVNAPPPTKDSQINVPNFNFHGLHHHFENNVFSFFMLFLVKICDQNIESK